MFKINISISDNATKLLVAVTFILFFTTFGSSATVSPTNGGNTDSYNNYKSLNVTSVAGQPKIQKVQPVKISCSDYSSTITINCTDINGKEDLDISNSTNYRVPYDLENFQLDTGGNTTAWVYKEWIRNGKGQLRIHYGIGKTIEENKAATWLESGQNVLSVYYLNESSGSAIDITGNYSSSGTTGTNYGINAVFDGGRGFDGSNDEIIFNNRSFGNTQEFTIVAYARPDSTSTNHTILHTTPDYEGSETGVGFDQGLTETDGLSFVVYSNNDPNQRITKPNYQTNNFYLLTGVYNTSDYYKFYVNASLVGSEVRSSVLDQPLGEPTIGSRGRSGGNDKFFNGGVDAVRIYTESKSKEWIQAEYDVSGLGSNSFFTEQISSGTTGANSLIINKKTTHETFESWDSSLYGGSVENYTTASTNLDMNGTYLNYTGSLNHQNIYFKNFELESSNVKKSWVSAYMEPTLGWVAVGFGNESLSATSGDTGVRCGLLNGNVDKGWLRWGNESGGFYDYNESVSFNGDTVYLTNVTYDKVRNEVTCKIYNISGTYEDRSDDQIMFSTTNSTPEYQNRLYPALWTNGKESTDQWEHYDDWIWKNGSTSKINITAPRNRSIFVRNSTTSNGTAWIIANGTYTGTQPTAVEANFAGRGWKTIDSNPSNGEWSGSVPYDGCTQGKLQIREASSPDLNTSLARISTGDLFFAYGQSNLNGQLNNQHSVSHPRLESYAWTASDTWKKTADPLFPTNTGSGSFWTLVINKTINANDCPVQTVQVADGGLSIKKFVPGGSYYKRLKSNISEATQGRNNLTALYIYQGERDATAGISNERENWKKYANYSRNNLSQDLGLEASLYIGQIGASSNYSKVDEVRLSQSDAWVENNYPNLQPGGSTYNVTTGDGLHFQTDSQGYEVAEEVWKALNGALYGSHRGYGPTFKSSQTLDNQTINVTFDQSLVQSSNTLEKAAWRVDAGGVEQSIANISFVSSDTVQIDLASSVSSNLTVSLGEQTDATGLNVPVSSSTGMKANTFVEKDVKEIHSASAPSIKSISINWLNLGGIESKYLNLSIDDKGENDIKNHTAIPSGTIGIFSNSTLRVDSPGNPFDWGAQLVDTSGLFTGYKEINFTRTTIHEAYTENATGTVNESWQVVNASAEVDVRGDPMQVVAGFTDPGGLVKRLRNGNISTGEVTG
ncbi:MAG: LamG-like jellyroll fold domain-containing protein, partial [Candidatus Nanohaloarchaea archaeon]